MTFEARAGGTSGVTNSPTRVRLVGPWAETALQTSPAQVCNAVFDVTQLPTELVNKVVLERKRNKSHIQTKETNSTCEREGKSDGSFWTLGLQDLAGTRLRTYGTWSTFD